LATALRAVQVRPLDAGLGRSAGKLLAASNTSDVIDAALVLLAAPGDRVYTSDPDDIAHLAEIAGLDVEVVGV
jgi:hypothetical protein